MFHIFNSVFLGPVLFTRCSIIMGLHYHVILDFCEMNVFLKVFSRVSLFGKYFLGGFLLVAKYFLGRSEIPNSTDPCL